MHTWSTGHPHTPVRQPDTHEVHTCSRNQLGTPIQTFIWAQIHTQLGTHTSIHIIRSAHAFTLIGTHTLAQLSTLICTNSAKHAHSAMLTHACHTHVHTTMPQPTTHTQTLENTQTSFPHTHAHNRLQEGKLGTDDLG